MSSLVSFANLVDGVSQPSGETFESFDPFTGKPRASILRCRSEEVDKAVRAAHSAFRSNAWPNSSPTARGRSETDGEGVFHFGFEVSDANAAESEAQRAGLAVKMRGRRQNRTGFTDYDTVDKAGVILLTRATNLPGK
jgi:hypothetical protein